MILARRIVELFLADFADVTQRVRGDFAEQVKPLRRFFSANHRIFILVRFDPGHVFGQSLFFHHDGFVLRLELGFFKAARQPFAFDAQFVHQQFSKLRIFVGNVFFAQQNVVSRLARDEYAALAVEDGSAPRRNRQLTNAILIGAFDVMLGIHHLQIPKAPDQQGNDRRHQISQNLQTDVGAAQIFCAVETQVSDYSVPWANGIHNTS